MNSKVLVCNLLGSLVLYYHADVKLSIRYDTSTMYLWYFHLLKHYAAIRLMLNNLIILDRHLHCWQKAKQNILNQRHMNFLLLPLLFSLMTASIKCHLHNDQESFLTADRDIRTHYQKSARWHQWEKKRCCWFNVKSSTRNQDWLNEYSLIKKESRQEQYL